MDSARTSAVFCHPSPPANATSIALPRAASRPASTRTALIRASSSGVAPATGSKVRAAKCHSPKITSSPERTTTGIPRSVPWRPA